MSKCDNCGSNRIATICSKARDLSYLTYRNVEHDGYLPDGFGIGGGDYVEFHWCLECGKIQGKFPITDESIEEYYNDEWEGEEEFKLQDNPTDILRNEDPDPELLLLAIDRFKELSEMYEEDAEAMSDEDWREYKDIKNAIRGGEVSKTFMNAFNRK